MVLDGCDIAVVAAAGSAGSTVEVGVGVAESACFAVAPLVTVAQSASAAIRIAAAGGLQFDTIFSMEDFPWLVRWHLVRNGYPGGRAAQPQALHLPHSTNVFGSLRRIGTRTHRDMVARDEQEFPRRERKPGILAVSLHSRSARLRLRGRIVGEYRNRCPSWCEQK